MISFATMAEPSSITAARQVGRWWRDVFNDLNAVDDASEPLVFVEPGASAPGHIYAGSLPAAAHGRLRPACSITVGPSGGRASSYESRATIALVCEAHASTQTQAIEMLQSLRRSVRRAPDDGGFAAPHVRNIVGAPALSAPGGAATRADLWRFLALEVLAEPQPLTLPDVAGGEGEAVATMTLVATVVPVTVEAAFALRVTNDSLGEAGVDLFGGALELTRLPAEGEPAFASIALLGLTIAQLIAAINAGTASHGFVAESAASFAADAQAVSLLGFFTRTLDVGASTVIAAER